MFDLEEVCDNSFRNFHVKGFDYLCLSRTPALTRKVYFFEGELANLPEIVIPHDHRYAFVTTVLSGRISNRRYKRCRPLIGQIKPQMSCFDRFSYMTPLNGGDGFTWENEEWLAPWTDFTFGRGGHYKSSAESIHTLDIRREGTVIMLEQLADTVPLGEPTSAWRIAGNRQPPNLSGLYDRMDADHARMRIDQFLDLVGNR